MSSVADGHHLTLRETASRIAAGSLTAEAAVERLLAVIEAREPAVGAWQIVSPTAIEEARRLDRAPRTGVLHGVPLGVKDVIDTAGLPTAYGSSLYLGNRPAADAACVAIARAKGAVMLGKTVSTEFAIFAPGKTRNPHHPEHTPGGSSSGSAAAVAAGMVPAAFGTQTSGSVIRPASFCGVVGCKPSFGLVERAGVKTLAQSFDTVGLFARDVADIAFLLSAVSDRPALAELEIARQASIGLYRTPQWDSAEPAAQAVFERAAAAVAAKGARIADVRPNALGKRYLDIHEAVMDWDVLHALSYERLFHLDRLAEKTRDYLGLVAGRASLARYLQGCADMAAAHAALPELFGAHDVLLTLSAPGEAPHGLASTGDPVFNRAWTMLHVPCVTVPAGVGALGLPIGVQIVGRIGDDHRVLAVAALVEAAVRDLAGEKP